MPTSGWSWSSATSPMAASPEPAGENTSTIIYTSGTTGKPKGVVHTFNSMAWGVSCATPALPHEQRGPLHLRTCLWRMWQNAC